MSSAASPISTMSLARILPFSSQSSLLGPSPHSVGYLLRRVPPHSLKLFLSPPHPWRNTFGACSCSCTSSESDSLPINDAGNGELDAEGRELREGVLEILEEAGVSKPDCVQIAANSPKYAKMLRDGVRDLDELSLWDSWMREKAEEKKREGGIVPRSFKEKVKRIAMEKGDNGKIPFLESIGLSLSSSIHLARLLSSESLPSLIHKVKYVKDIFFSGSDDGMLAGKLARRIMFSLSISVDEDVQQVLSFFEKIEARRGGLVMLGSGDASFRHLIESFPRLLLLSVESNLKPMAKFLEDVGVPRQRIGNVLLLFPTLLFLEIGAVKAALQPFEKYGALNDNVGRVLVKYPWVLSKSIRENYKEILAFFETQKVPKVSVDRAVRDWPLLLGCSTDKLKAMVEKFDELGVKTTKLGGFFLRDLGLDKESIAQVLVRCPEVFATSTEDTLLKKVEFLTNLGILKQQLPRVIKKYPEFLVSDVDRTVMPRLRYLMKAGLTKRDIASMVTRFSPLLGYSIEEVVRPKLDFLLNTMGKPLKDIVEYPRYFSYSLEKKIRPRFLVLKSASIECNLKDMLAKNDEEFTTEYLGIEKTLVSIR